MASARSATLVIVVTVAALAGGLAAVLGMARGGPEPRARNVVPTYTVESGTVGSTYTAAGLMEWKPTDVLSPGIDSGTLTSTTIGTARSVGDGEVVLTVDLQPVVAVLSPVPFFRDLGGGATGADVEALIRFLGRQRFLTSTERERGTFTARVTASVRRWQTALGQPPTGIVSKRSLLAFSSLPARIATTDPIGSALSGEPFVRRWLDDARFTVSVGGEIRVEVDAGTAATVLVDGKSYPARVGGQSVEEVADGAVASDAVVATLVRSDGRPGPLCGADCQIPDDETKTVTSVELVLLAPKTGPVLPAAAIGVDAGGSTYVVDASGSKRRAVTVLAEADGRVVLSGIDVGTRVAALVPP